MIMSAIIIIAYTSGGGFLAASTTDLIQSIVMTFALIILVIFGINVAGGMNVVVDNAKGLKDYLSFTALHNPDGESKPYSLYSFLSIVSTLAWGLGYFGMPHILLRFMAIENKEKVKTSRRIASVWVVISMTVAIFIGIIGNALSANETIKNLAGSSEAETIIMELATFMSKKGLFLAILGGLIFSGILASTMSTSDSQLLAASSSMSEDLLKGMFRIKMNDKQSMISARIVLVVIAALSIIVAWNPDSSVFRIVSFAWAGFGATFGPVMLLALFWKRSNKYGAVAGLATGGIMVLLWKFVISGLGGVFEIYELLPAFLLAFIVNIVVSLVTEKPAKDMIDEFDAVNAELKA